MTVVDERSRVPPLDAGALERLAAALDREGVVAGMLIGSRARGKVTPLSDVDVAVWHEPDLDAPGRMRLQLELARAASKAVGSDEVDVVLLNRAPPLMRHRAMSSGKRLVERDRENRVRMETRAMLEYLDTEPLRAELGRAMRRRMEEGRFGRR